jgi:hypothetical protein
MDDMYDTIFDGTSTYSWAHCSIAIYGKDLIKTHTDLEHEESQAQTYFCQKDIYVDCCST